MLVFIVCFRAGEPAAIWSGDATKYATSVSSATAESTITNATNTTATNAAVAAAATSEYGLFEFVSFVSMKILLKISQHQNVTVLESLAVPIDVIAEGCQHIRKFSIFNEPDCLLRCSQKPCH
jgi:hypothetical protein